MGEGEPLTITIADQQFRVRPGAAQAEQFARAEQEANARLAERAPAPGTLPGQRALAMLVFELCLELDELRREVALTQQGRERIAALLQRLEHLTPGTGEH